MFKIGDIVTFEGYENTYRYKIVKMEEDENSLYDFYIRCIFPRLSFVSIGVTIAGSHMKLYKPKVKRGHPLTKIFKD